MTPGGWVKPALRIAALVCGALLVGGVELLRMEARREAMDDGVRLLRNGEPLLAIRRFETVEKLCLYAFWDSPDWVDSSRFGRAIAYVQLGRYAQAEPLFERALPQMEKALGPSHPKLAVVHNHLARALAELGRTAEAESHVKRALEITEAARGAEHPDTVLQIGMLVELLSRQGRLTEAEFHAWRAWRIVERTSPPKQHEATANALLNLADLKLLRGELEEGASFSRQSLAAYEQAKGAGHPGVSGALARLAGAYQRLGIYDEAERLLLRQLETMERAYGTDNVLLASVLDTLAETLVTSGNPARAEPHAARSLRIKEKAFGPQHAEVADALVLLAGVFRAQLRDASAEPLYLRAVSILEGLREPDPLRLSTALNNLAQSYLAMHRPADAGPLHRRALALREKALGPDDPGLARGLVNLSAQLEAEDRIGEALAAIRRATRLLRSRDVAVPDLDDRQATSEQRAMLGAHIHHVRMLAASARGDESARHAVLEESFEAGQRAHLSSASAQLARMAARFGARSDALARLTRERQDIGLRLERAWADSVRTAAANAASRSTIETRLREDQARLRRALEAIDARLERDFPNYRELSNPRPVPAAELQKLLARDEAMAVFLVGRKDAFAWVLRNDRARFERLVGNRGEFDNAVRSLRAHLDLGSADAAAVLGKPFPVSAAHDLYQRLFSRFGDLLSGARHLIVVPDGPLQSLPFALLVAEPPASDTAPLRDLSRVEWLAKRHAVTALPSVGSLRVLRALSDARRAPDPFAGFGDPLLEGDRNSLRAGSAAVFTRSGAIDLRELRKLARLPDSADELKAIAQALRAPPESVHLGKDATESRVKQMEMARFRTIAFATHGLVGGELPGIAEPALVLSPPAVASDIDDGLLTASEITQLRLNADWVILSACNTAAADGTPGAEGLSGLARAFFYAGASTLLVSHWAVSSEAATALTTRMFREYAGGASKAESLRRAMLELAKRSDALAHPAMWAPFVVVGEGARP